MSTLRTTDQGQYEQQYRRPKTVTDEPSLTIRASQQSAPYLDDAVVRVGASGTQGSKLVRPSFADEPCPTIMGGGGGGMNTSQFGLEITHPVEPEADISRFAIGAESDKLDPGQRSSRYFSLVRAPLDGPSPCVTAQGAATANSVAAVIHPTEKRKFSIEELKRICSFPADFILTGTYAQRWEWLGRAVPPPMMRAIAETLRDEVFPRIREREAKRVRSRGKPRDAKKPVRRRGSPRLDRAPRA